MCHAMHINEVRSCVFLYLNNHTCVIPWNTQSSSQPRHTHCETSCSSIKLPNLVKLCKMMVVRLSIVAPISTPLRVSKIGIQTHFFIIDMYIDPLLVVNGCYLACTQSKKPRLLHNSFHVFQHNIMYIPSIIPHPLMSIQYFF